MTVRSSGNPQRRVGGLRISLCKAVESDAFIALDHTARNFRKEFWFPRLLDRSRYDQWKAEGSKRLGEKIRERVKELIKAHRASPLPENIASELDRIVMS